MTLVIRKILLCTLLSMLSFVMISLISCSKKTSCPAYDNFAADHKNMNEGDGEGLNLPKKSRKRRSKKTTEWGLQGKRFKKTFKSYKPDK